MSNNRLIALAMVMVLGACNNADNSNKDQLVNPELKTEAPKLVDSCSSDDELAQGEYFLDQSGIKDVHLKDKPADVRCFVVNAAICEHFGGEEPYDEERSREIQAGAEEYCPKANRQVPSLKEKYKHDPDVIKIIALCEEGSSALCVPVKSGNIE